MPENITIAAFILGAVMLLISVVGGKFKIFGAEVSGVAGPAGRVMAGVAGTIFIGIGLFNSLEARTQPSLEQTATARTESDLQAKSKTLPATYKLGKLTCIRPQEPKGEDRVYLKLGNSTTKVWELKAGMSVLVELIAEAGTSISLWEKDGIMKDGDDDFLGTASLQGQGGKLHFEIPATGNHLYTLSYESDS